jgi:4-hydroxy-2-oxoheptanedioate aldolase
MVRINKSKEKMLAGEPSFGYALALGSTIVAETIGNSGIDHVLIDGQHGSYGIESVIATFQALASTPATPMVRVPTNNFTQIGRHLDEGALGIVVPMVDTPEQAKAAAEATRFPPHGIRSWGYGRAFQYGRDYTDWIDEQVFLAVQIESITSVNNAEAILATPGVDGCWVGPADLALSMGIHPRDMHGNEEHQRALERIVEACKNTGKIAGYSAGSPKQGLELAKKGFQFLTVASDLGFILQGAAEGLKVLDGKN